MFKVHVNCTFIICNWIGIHSDNSFRKWVHVNIPSEDCFGFVLSPWFLCLVSSDEMSVRTGQGSDEVLVSQAVWDYLAAAGRPWLLDFEDKQGLSAGIVRRGERGGCCAVRLSPVEGRTSLMEGPVSPATRKAFIDLCRCARKEMTKQEAAPKRKRSLLPCIGVVETDAEGSLLPPPPPQPRRSQRQQQRCRKSTEMDSCTVLPMLHEATAKTDCDSGAGRSNEDDSAICSICMGEMVEKTTLEKCSHSFCRSCLEQAFQVKKACPVCRLVYGQLIGNQPGNGSMMVERDPDLELPGHEGYGCICIIYSFPPGFQSVSISTLLWFAVLFCHLTELNSHHHNAVFLLVCVYIFFIVFYFSSKSTRTLGCGIQAQIVLPTYRTAPRVTVCCDCCGGLLNSGSFSP